MSDILPAVRVALEKSGCNFDVMACDPELADTKVFCERYSIPFENSANAILVRSKKGEPHFTVCVLLATHRLDVNHAVRQKLEARKVSFASAEETRKLTNMEIGGVTPIGLPNELPVWVDADVMKCAYIILGGGNRISKLKITPEIFYKINSAEVVPGLALKSDVTK